MPTPLYKLLGLLLSLMVILLSGCADTSSPTLGLGTNIWPGYEPLYLARNQGFLDDKKVHLVEFSSSSQTLQSFRNEVIDAAALTLDEALLLLDSGEKIKIVLVMDISNGGDAIIGQSNLSQLSDIKGKRVGFESNALGAYIITRALEIAGLNRNSIKLVALDIDEQNKAFKQGKVDAVVTFDPVRKQLLKSGGMLLFDSSQIPGEIVDVLVVRENYLVKYPAQVQYLLDAWHQSLKIFKQHPTTAAKILGQRMKLNTDETLQSYTGLLLPTQKRNLQLIHQYKPELLKSAQKLAQTMQREGLLNNNVNVAELFTTQYLNYP